VIARIARTACRSSVGEIVLTGVSAWAGRRWGEMKEVS
jgi:hypothetical protein